MGDETRKAPIFLTIGADDDERERVRNGFQHFEAAAAECFHEEDKKRIFAVIARYPDGVDGFNRRVRTLSAQLLTLGGWRVGREATATATASSACAATAPKQDVLVSERARAASSVASLAISNAASSDTLLVPKALSLAQTVSQPEGLIEKFDGATTGTATMDEAGIGASADTDAADSATVSPRKSNQLLITTIRVDADASVKHERQRLKLQPRPLRRVRTSGQRAPRTTIGRPHSLNSSNE